MVRLIFSIAFVGQLLVSFKTLAQTAIVEIRVEQAYFHNYVGDEYGPRIRLYKNQWLDNSTNALWYNSNCIKLNAVITGLLPVNKSYVTNITGSTFDLIVVTHEERKKDSDDCTVQGIADVSFNKPDKFQDSTKIKINLNDYEPGKFSDVITVTNEVDNTTASVYLKIRYYPVSLSPPTGNNGLNCSNVPYTLSTKNLYNNSFTNTTGLKYKWEYHIAGQQAPPPGCREKCQEDFETCLVNNPGNYSYCGTIKLNCDNNCVEEEIWHSLGSPTDLPVIEFTPLTSIFKDVLTSTTGVQFRVTPIGAELSGQTSSASAYFSFTPPPPTATTLSSTPSCKQFGTGTVTVSGVARKFPNYRYILREGDIAEPGCNPNVQITCLPPSDKTGLVTGQDNFVIEEVPAGIYTLFLLNDAGVQGFCPQRVGTIDVEEIPTLSINPDPLTPQDASCAGVNGGSVAFTIANGNPANVTYELTNNTDYSYYERQTSVANASVTFDNLSPGNYNFTADDGCTNQVLQTFQIKQPVKMDLIEFEKVPATCSSPGNGVARIKVVRSLGAFDRSVSPLIHYQVFKGGNIFREAETTETTYTWSDLPPDDYYKIVAKEKGSGDCNGVVQTFSIDGPAPLGLEALQVTALNCFNANNGSIVVTGKGGDGSYLFSLRNTQTGAMQSNTTGEFKNLLAGQYIVSVKNTFACGDVFTSDVIELKQPEQLNAVVMKDDISCFEAGDGKLTALVTGGIKDYSYSWEVNLDGWIQTGSTMATVSNKQAGEYRVRITDANGCQAYSSALTIHEPTALTIAGVAVDDIKCFGEKGLIAIEGVGGTKPYGYYYASAEVNIFSNDEKGVSVSAGSYDVTLKDANGCTTKHPDKILITAPPTKLQFTALLSDYNGFNVSCFNGSNGKAELIAEGGNGGPYDGYEYAIDSESFQPSSLLEGINAGSHTLMVRDGRGCVASNITIFTQTSSVLEVEVLAAQDVVCYGDETGSLSLGGKGGLAPYAFGMDTGDFGTRNVFENLKAGEYFLSVKDKNGCKSSSVHEIKSINPRIMIDTDISNVSCYDGKNGAIEAHVTGGVAPFRYAWSSVPSTDAVIANVKAGSYTLTVTDNANCKMMETAEVLQPDAPLKLNVLSTPVCYGKENGQLTASASGGTAPYHYAVGGTADFQSQNSFAKPEGTYSLTAKDANGCIATVSATIDVKNIKPEPNFLAATTRNAQDTLAIIDISVPKPDSIFWIFDKQAFVIDGNQWAPQLWFENAGTYSVSMTGYFGGCDYAVTKNITLNPYDPTAKDETLPGYKPIESVTVTPNPSNGAFEVSVVLNKKYRLSVVVFDVMGAQHYNGNWKDVKEVRENVILNNVAPGVYILRAITESDAQDVRIIINK